MINLLDIYTKLKLKIGNKIILTYQTNDGTKITEEVILKDIIDFSYILISSSKENITKNIPFISKTIIIESIIFKDSSIPIYINPYFKENENNDLFLNYQEIEHLIKNILNKNYLSFEKRKKLINEYLSTEYNISYNKLFFSKKQKEEFETLLNLLISELTKYAIKIGLDPTIKNIGTGTTSLVYEIGDKILKIGKPRRTKILPYCEYLLQPIINRDFEFDGYPIHIEVTQKVLVLDNKDGFASLSEDEHFLDAVSTLNKNLYSIGLSTNDLSPANVGILLDENKIHFDEIHFDIANEQATSIKNNNYHKILPKGRYVIIDLDSLTIENETKYTNYLEKLKSSKEKAKKLKLEQ